MMNNNNKILTVSYGTFSCTLEGFDDSFGTMKAIAEYFRDLAADDRYFGAEPPQPDAEMLARIAEREIERRVEGRLSEGRVVLSARPTEGEAPETTQEVAAAAPVAEAPAPVAFTPAPEIDTVADQAPTETEAPAQDAEVAMDRAPEIDAEDEVEADSAEAFFATAPSAADDADDADEDALEDMPEAEPVAAATIAPQADSIADKLERIRAVVSQADDEDEIDDDYSEDEHAEDFASRFASDADDEPADTVEAEADADAVRADAIAEVEAAISADDEVEALTVEDEDAQEDTLAVLQPQPEVEGEDDVSAILARLSQEAQPEEAAAPARQDEDDMTTLTAQDDDDEEDDLDADLSNILSDMGDEDDQPAAAPAVARVVKVKRADLEDAIAQGKLEELSDEDDAESSLSDEDEAELLRELAEVEAELPGTDDDADIVDEIDTGSEAQSDEAPVQDAATDDEDVDRLMAKAEVEMDEPEGTRRRDAFAHLRAAVAAKKADDGIGSDDEEDVAAYRTDLASVVKPRRPAARGGQVERPGTGRPAPLKLVAEQRIDTDQAAARGPVRPRRVASQPAVVDASDAGNFVEFAEEMGAQGLPDLLEAAAAYLAFVEEREHFSRPQLMTKVRQVEGADFSREDGLRSFGQLLRAGKIEKIRGGRFAASGDIGFRPDQRAAG